MTKKEFIMTKISVLMPLYNTNELYLREAIESIINQSYRDFELILINDSSTDENVEKVALSYTDKRIRYYKNEANLGISATRNKLLDLSTGEYLAIMDHDDISLPERFAKEVAFLDVNQDVGVVSCCYERFPKLKLKYKSLNNAEIEEDLMHSCAMLHPASMIRKSVLTENNLRYEEKYSPAEDYALWCRLIGKTNFANLPDILFRYRDHGNNTSKTQEKKMKRAQQAVYTFVRHDNPELWEKSQQKICFTSRILLFHFIPLLSIKKQGKHIHFYLFGFIPFMSCKVSVR